MRKILILANGTDEVSIVVPFSVATNGTSFKEGEGALANSSGFGIGIDEATYIPYWGLFHREVQRQKGGKE